MSTATAILHIQGRAPDAVEQALREIFAHEERSEALRVEGSYSAVLKRALDPELDAGYRYLIVRPRDEAGWTPLVELGNRTVGLDVELSKRLDGAAVLTLYVFDDGLSGYRLARNGVEVDRYASDPTYYTEQTDEAEDAPAAGGDEREIEAERGRPERFADLLPAGTTPEEFARVVLRPGWWEAHDADATGATGDQDDVDEVDRARCIALALEVWTPSEYPFVEELEEIPNKVAGPAIGLAFV